MKALLLAAAAGLSLAASTVAQADVPNAPTYAQNRPAQTQQAQNGQGVHAYVTQSSRGTWLFQANPNQGANS